MIALDLPPAWRMTGDDPGTGARRYHRDDGTMAIVEPVGRAGHLATAPRIRWTVDVLPRETAADCAVQAWEVTASGPEEALDLVDRGLGGRPRERGGSGCSRSRG